MTSFHSQSSQRPESLSSQHSHLLLILVPFSLSCHVRLRASFLASLFSASARFVSESASFLSESASFCFSSLIPFCRLRIKKSWPDGATLSASSSRESARRAVAALPLRELSASVAAERLRELRPELGVGSGSVSKGAACVGFGVGTAAFALDDSFGGFRLFLSSGSFLHMLRHLSFRCSFVRHLEKQQVGDIFGEMGCDIRGEMGRLRKKPPKERKTKTRSHGWKEKNISLLERKLVVVEDCLPHVGLNLGVLSNARLEMCHLL